MILKYAFGETCVELHTKTLSEMEELCKLIEKLLAQQKIPDDRAEIL